MRHSVFFICMILAVSSLVAVPGNRDNGQAEDPNLASEKNQEKPMPERKEQATGARKTKKLLRTSQQPSFNASLGLKTLSPLWDPKSGKYPPLPSNFRGIHPIN